MRRTAPIRLLSVVVAAAALAAVPFAGVASAAAPPATCLNPKSVVSVAKKTATVTLSSCTNKPATGGSGVLVVSFTSKGTNPGTVTGKITWKGTGTTNIFLKTTAGKTPNKCKTGTVLFNSAGKVTGGTGKAGTLIPKGSPYSESVCANTKTGATTQLPGTKVII